MKSKILVTGASGFVGANLVRRIVDEHEVHVFIRESSNLWRINDIKDKLTIHYCDLNDIRRLRECLNEIKPDYIFHLATYGAYPRTQKDIRRIVDVSYIGTVNMVIASMDISYRLFINAGTTSEYGKKNEPMREYDLLEPVMAYGAVKAGSSIFCQTMSKEHDKPICTFRLFSVYGPYEELFRLVPDVFVGCLRNKEVRVSDGSGARDFVYTDDIVDAYVMAMKNPKYVKGEIINIGSGVQTKVGDVIKKIAQLTGSGRIIWGAKNQENFENDVWVADISKAKRLLGWQPKHDLDSGLMKTRDWYKKHLELYGE